MNLFNRLLRKDKDLADNKPARRPRLDVELGVSGDFKTLYEQEEARSDDVSVEQYRKMLDNDGTVEAVYNLLTLPIKAARYSFTLPEGENGEQELQLVKDNFELPPHKGGMSTPFDLVLADMLRALAEGFRLFEKVWTVRQDGKLIYRKLAPRDGSTITLLRDEHGGFDGAHQRAWNGFEYIDVKLPVQQCFLFTYAKERSFLYGRSAFTSAYYHYDRKHKLYYLQQLGAQAAAVPGKKVTVPESVANDASRKHEVEAAVQKFGSVKSTVLLPPGFDLNEYKTSPMDLQEAINHQDTLIARSVLAQFLVLAGSSTGSYSLGESDKENFLTALQGVMRQIEQHINFYLIPDLVNYNFGTGVYPEFRFEAIGSDTKQLLLKAFSEIVKRPDVPAYIIEGIVRDVATQLGIDPQEFKSREDDDGEDDDTPPEDKQEAQPKQNSAGAGERSLADTYHRKLTDAERRVNLADLERRAQSSEEKLLAEAESFFASLKEDTTKRLSRLLERGDLAALKKFELASFAPYRKATQDAMMAEYLYGKRTAADEVGGKIPQTPSKSRQYISTQAQAIIDKQKADLTFAVQNEVTKELRSANLTERRNLGITDILARIASLFLTFQEKNVVPGISVTLSGSLNLGRADSFIANGSNIDRMQYSAILDGRTTKMCRDLDNSVVTYEEYRATKWMPPCHFRCRSIWVAILKDDAFKPEFRPIPAAPGGLTEPQL